MAWMLSQSIFDCQDSPIRLLRGAAFQEGGAFSSVKVDELSPIRGCLRHKDRQKQGKSA